MSKDWSKTTKNIDEGVDVLVTNFNKMKRLLKEKKLSLSLLEYIVIDEADVFIETGQTKDMVEMIKFQASNIELKETKIFFVTATFTKKLAMFLKMFFEHKIIYLLTSDTHYNLANLQHTFIPIWNQNRLELLDSELQENFMKKKDSYYMIFCNTVACTRAVEFYLNKIGYKTMALHGEMPSKIRIENYKKFCEK